jgi:ketosteroid isomerase-like protein
MKTDNQEGNNKMTIELRRYASVVVVIIAASVLVRSLPQHQSSGAEQLLTLESKLQKATAEHLRSDPGHGWDGYVSYLADDATYLENGDPIVSGKENIRRALGPGDSDTTLTWTPVKAEMSSSGDLGYTFGTYVYKAKNKGGKLATTYGKYVSIWKKQKDGTWKLVLDMGNSAPRPMEK